MASALRTFKKVRSLIIIFRTPLIEICTFSRLAFSVPIKVLLEAILNKFSIAKIEALSIDHLIIIQGDISAIESGQEFAKDLYPYLEKDEKKVDEINDRLSKKAKQVKDKTKSEKKSKPKQEKPKEKVDTETGEVTEISEEEAKIQEWKDSSDSERLDFFIKNRGSFNLEKYCTENKIAFEGEKANFSNLDVNHQSKVCYMITLKEDKSEN